MSLELEELYQEVILDHSRRPRNFGDLADAAVRVHGDNPACGDEIHLGVKFGPDGELQEIKFTGHGCAISQASASLMTMKLKGKSRAEAEGMLRAFHHLVTDETSRGAADVGRSSNDAGRAEISSAGQVRHAGLAGGRAGVAAKRRRSDVFRPKPILPCRDTVVCQTRRRLLERTLLNQAVGAKSESGNHCEPLSAPTLLL